MAINAHYRTPSVSGLISEARNLIVDDNKDDAMILLRKALRLSPNNVDALLLYAQASPSRNSARRMLGKVLAIDPTNTDAQMLRHQLDQDATWDRHYKPAVPPAMPVINRIENKDPAIRSDDAGGNTSENKLMVWLGLMTAVFAFFGFGYLLNGEILMALAFIVS
ncbi:MAG: hypothetical protein AAFR81_28280 [Chloroflexota bacterium]